MPTAQCRKCGDPFRPNGARQFYCRQACYLAATRTRNAESLITRFWGHVERQGPIPAHCPDLGPCWLWTASAVRGYGQFHLPRSTGTQHTIYAHRFAWQITNGPIPDDLSILHRCDTPLCVRPDHLLVGTQADNLADARAKGRLVDGRHLIKVDDAGMADIRVNYRPRQNGKQLAATYGISLIHLLRIVNGTARVQHSQADAKKTRGSRGKAA